jgi:hypothetical protein
VRPHCNTSAKIKLLFGSLFGMIMWDGHHKCTDHSSQDLVHERQLEGAGIGEGEHVLQGIGGVTPKVLYAAGFLGFYKGMHTKIVQSILAAALLMAIKEKMTQAALLILDPNPPALAPLVSLTISTKPN